MEIVLNECIGSLTISCLIDFRHFTVSNYIQQCCKGVLIYFKNIKKRELQLKPEWFSSFFLYTWEFNIYLLMFEYKK